ncbi:MAG: DUF429 domain-containing protein [Nitrospinota bacterium]
MKEPTAVGIDLAGSPGRPTGLCVLKGLRGKTFLLFSDDEILAKVPREAALIAIDAPLFLPKGRCCLEDDCPCAGGSHFRQCDLELRELKIKFFPVTLGPMRALTQRGIALRKRLEGEGFSVIETYPGGAQDLWGIPRQKDMKGLRRALQGFGFRGDPARGELSRHELDAITCALVAREHLKGRSLELGDREEGLLVLPAAGRI